MTPTSDAVLARTWDDFIGQQPMKDELDFRIRASIAQQQALGHVFLSGPPGFGKTSIARIVAQQLGSPLLEFDSPPKLEALIAAVHRYRRECEVIFLDEIHRYSAAEQEQLLTMVSPDPLKGYVRGAMGQPVKVGMTVIAATTEEHKVVAPLRDRFQIAPEIVEYSDEEMAQILGGMIRRLEVPAEITPAMCTSLSAAGGGVPRRLEPIATAIRDMAALDERITVSAVLKRAGVDPNGLDWIQVKYLEMLSLLGGRAGLEKLARGLRKHPTLVADKEWALLRQGLIEFGNGSGRILTEKGYERLDEIAAFGAAEEEA